jgi:hypothetical protein
MITEEEDTGAAEQRSTAEGIWEMLQDPQMGRNWC